MPGDHLGQLQANRCTTLHLRRVPALASITKDRPGQTRTGGPRPHVASVTRGDSFFLILFDALGLDHTCELTRSLA